MANRTRNIVLRVPVTAEERAMIERKMQQMGTGCFSVYARKMLIDGYVIRLDYSDVKAMTAELEMSRNVQSGNTQNLKSSAALDQAAVCACAHSRYFTGGSPSGLRV